jgi:hypothetical protein
VTGSSKRKGDRAELEAAGLIRDHLGYPAACRELGAGRRDDVGDIHGVPQFVIQVANWADVDAAARQKPRTAEQQRVNAREPFASTFVRWPRVRGGDLADAWRVVLTVEQWAALVREVNA